MVHESDAGETIVVVGMLKISILWEELDRHANLKTNSRLPAQAVAAYSWFRLSVSTTMSDSWRTPSQGFP